MAAPMAEQNARQSTFKLTPLWMVTFVACGLAIYVVVRHEERVTEIGLGDTRIVLGGGSTSAVKNQEQLQELAQQVKDGETPSVQAPTPSELGDLNSQGTVPSGGPSVMDRGRSTVASKILGTWQGRDSGGSYFIDRSGDQYTFRETSSLYGIPIDTAAGSGVLDGDTLSLRYNTVLGTSGIAQLSLERDDLLSGQFRDFVTGVVTPVALVR